MKNFWEHCSVWDYIAMECSLDAHELLLLPGKHTAGWHIVNLIWEVADIKHEITMSDCALLQKLCGQCMEANLHTSN